MFYAITCYYNYYKMKVLKDQRMNFRVLYMVHYSDLNTALTSLLSSVWIVPIYLSKCFYIEVAVLTFIFKRSL